MADNVPSDLQRLIDDQHGLATFPQLRRFGFSRTMVQRAIESGRWQSVLHGVYSVTTGPLDRSMVQIAALLYGGGSSVLSHWTSVQEWLDRPDDDAPVHVTVRYGRSAVDQPPTYRRRSGLLLPKRELVHPGVKVHRSRAFDHIVVADTLPRTSRADAVIECATAEQTARAATETTIGLVTDMRIRLVDIRSRVEHRLPRRHRHAIAGALQLLADGVQSMLEYRYAVDVERAHGFPPAIRQAPVVVEGRTLYEDVVYQGGNRDVIVRLDGRATHAVPEIAFRDMARDNAAELSGTPRLTLGWRSVDGNPCDVARKVAFVLRREGYEFGGGTCARCA